MNNTGVPIFTQPDWFVFRAPRFYARSPEDVAEWAAKLLGYSLMELRTQNRKRKVTEARAAVAVYLMETFPNMTLSQIGRVIDRNHATVIYYRDISAQIKEVKKLIFKIKNNE